MLKNKTLSKFTAKTKEIHQQAVGPLSGSALFTKTSPQYEHELHTKLVREEPFTGTSKAERHQRRLHPGGVDDRDRDSWYPLGDCATELSKSDEKGCSHRSQAASIQHLQASPYLCT